MVESVAEAVATTLSSGHRPLAREFVEELVGSLARGSLSKTTAVPQERGIRPRTGCEITSLAPLLSLKPNGHGVLLTSKASRQLRTCFPSRAAVVPLPRDRI